jgi:hypothetical protein
MDFTPRRLFASPAFRRAVGTAAKNMARAGYKKARAYGQRYVKRRRTKGRGIVTRQARPSYARNSRMYGEAAGRSKKQISSTAATYGTGVSPNALYKSQVINIEEGPNINQRLGNTVFLRGIRFCGELRNTNKFPMYYNMAIVSLKHQLTYVQNDTDLSYPNFFRAEGTTERAINFTGELDSIVYHCRAINTDLFNVFAHQRMLLPSAVSADNEFDNPNNDHTYKTYKFLKRYVKINRTIRWINNGDDILLNPIYLLQWSCKYGGTGEVILGEADPVDTKFEVITFYNQEKRN